jgi:hypothetical protein
MHRLHLKQIATAIAALAALALGGSALAGAAGSSSTTTTNTTSTSTPAPPSGSGSPPGFPAGEAPGTAAHEDAEKAVTGQDAEKAKAAALASLGGGKAGAVTTNFRNTGYEVTVTKTDGSQVTVHLDSSFKGMTPPAGPGQGAPGGQMAPNSGQTAPGSGQMPPAGQAPSSA